jgi:hypothetical protein
MWDIVKDENSLFKMHSPPFAKFIFPNYLRYERRSAHVNARNMLDPN